MCQCANDFFELLATPFKALVTYVYRIKFEQIISQKDYGYLFEKLL